LNLIWSENWSGVFKLAANSIFNKNQLTMDLYHDLQANLESATSAGK